ncbi:MAG: LON peptidase substrate-binding domain-containing protein [Candidatus Electryonea clarkiae]|nr:LON peptidase substrate-binding domain-containing protein [Candidatus Electryonea clarkiae]
MYKSKIIPIFQLERVLFPKMILPMHIFETHYKRMIADCINNNAQFGIITDSGFSSDLVGTTASVYRVVKKYDDGRYDILALGEDRFLLRNMLTDVPFPMGEVEFIDDLPGEIISKENISDLLNRFWRFISQLGLKKELRSHLESVVSQLEVEREISYIIGQTIGLDNSRQRKLLGEVSGEDRVFRLTTELKQLKSINRLARDMFENDNFDPNNN